MGNAASTGAAIGETKLGYHVLMVRAVCSERSVENEEGGEGGKRRKWMREDLSFRTVSTARRNV